MCVRSWEGISALNNDGLRVCVTSHHHVPFRCYCRSVPTSARHTICYLISLVITFLSALTL